MIFQHTFVVLQQPCADMSAVKQRRLRVYSDDSLVLTATHQTIPPSATIRTTHFEAKDKHCRHHQLKHNNINHNNNSIYSNNNDNSNDSVLLIFNYYYDDSRFFRLLLQQSLLLPWLSSSVAIDLLSIANTKHVCLVL